MAGALNPDSTLDQSEMLPMTSADDADSTYNRPWLVSRRWMRTEEGSGPAFQKHLPSGSPAVQPSSSG